MNTSKTPWLCLIALLPAIAIPAHAAVSIHFLKPSHQSAQPIGTTIAWTVHATDSNPGPLTFQFSVAPPNAPFAVVKDYNVGKLNSPIWVAQPFLWTPTGIEGSYRVKVSAKDFASGETATKVMQFDVTPLATGTMPVVIPSNNPLVAIFNSPSCPSGSMMRVNFQQQSQATPATQTSWLPCRPPNTMTFEIAGMYPTTAYQMFSQTQTGSQIVNGLTLTYTTGAMPAKSKFPSFTVNMAPGSQTDPDDIMVLFSETRLGKGTHFPHVATDLYGQILWYYYPSDPTGSNFLTRPLQDGTLLTIESGQAWNSISQQSQLLRQIDLAGHILKETNTGVIQQELLAMGAQDANPCDMLPKPAPVGSACLGAFHHDLIRSLPHGYSAVLAEVEKIFPPGTQGDTSGLPVDVMGDMIIVLNDNWQVIWYFDTFDHAGGGTQLDSNRAAVLGETCVPDQVGCPPLFLLGTGIAPKAMDWLHANSLYYWPQTSDIIWSSRHQDWVMKIDYNDGKGKGDVLWRMGPGGDFQFDNIYKDRWPWFSHQHNVGIQGNGSGVMTIFDNGNTRISAPDASTGGTPGLGPTACMPHDCNSRGMALTFDEKLMRVRPVLSVDLGVYAMAMGSADLLADGNYFFVPAIVALGPDTIVSYGIQVLPTVAPGGIQVFNVTGSEVYRGWQMPSLYAPPAI